MDQIGHVLVRKGVRYFLLTSGLLTTTETPGSISLTFLLLPNIYLSDSFVFPPPSILFPFRLELVNLTLLLFCDEKFPSPLSQKNLTAFV